MEGEIITAAEMSAALKHAQAVERVLDRDPIHQDELEPVRDFLNNLAWKGAAR